MGRKGSKRNPCYEAYEVKFSYQRADGYWNYGVTEIVAVPVPEICGKGGREKEAERILREKYPNCKIVNIAYV